MKRLLVIGLLICSSAFAQSDSQIRFRELEWAAPAKNIAGLKLVENSSGIKCYVKSAEKLKVGDAVLEKIRYCYYQDKLGYVMLDYKGTINQITLKDIFDKKYGTPSRPNRFMETYWWNIGEEVAIHMEFSGISDLGTIIYRYKPVSDLQANDRNSSNEDASKDL